MKLKISILFVCIIGALQLGNASDLIEITPVTNKILMLHFDDGYVDYHGLGEDGSSDVVHKKLFSISRGKKPEFYTITSSDDGNYAEAKHPSQVGRKSKGKDFTINYAQSTPLVMEHFIYLTLPFPMQEANTYDIHLDRPATNGDDFSFRFEIPLVRSETIHVNQIGYAPQAPVKLAYLSHWMGDFGPADLAGYNGNSFSLMTIGPGAMEKKYTGEILLRKDLESDGPDCGYPDHAPYGSYTGADVYVCDFSDFTDPGEYVLVVDNMGASFPFRIDKDVYREAFYTTIRGLYLQRCGTALEEPYTHWTRGRCHHPVETDTVILSDWMYMDGENAFTQLPQHATEKKQPWWGGWHDAGDWDRRHLHIDACQALMLTYELRPENFSDDELNIPESGNGIPDILDEAKWNIDFFKRLQDEDGGVHGGIETIHHPQQGVGSAGDRDQWYAYAPDAVASFHYAGGACQMGWCLKLAGFPDMLDEYVESAKRAYDWAMVNTRPEDKDTPLVRDLRFFAAAWLFKTTGEKKYQDQFVADNQIKNEYTSLSEWQQREQEWGVWTFVTTDQPGIDTALKTKLEKATVNWAKSSHIDNAKKRSYRFGNHWWIPVGWGQSTIPRILPLAVAWQVTGDETFLSYAYTTCDYMLGANPLNMVWVTGLGERSPQQVLHIDSWYYHQDKGMAPGLVPFGPYTYDVGSLDPWGHYWGQYTAYPDAAEWPSHELWFENRYSPDTNEFVVNTIGDAAAAYGFLCEPGGKFTTTEQDKPVAVQNFKLHPNYPNPFNAQTTIMFDVSARSNVEISIYDMLGRRVRVWEKQHYAAGSHRLVWNGSDQFGLPVASGLYFIKMSAEGKIWTNKALLIK